MNQVKHNRSICLRGNSLSIEVAYCSTIADIAPPCSSFGITKHIKYVITIKESWPIRNPQEFLLLLYNLMSKYTHSVKRQLECVYFTNFDPKTDILPFTHKVKTYSNRLPHHPFVCGSMPPAEPVDIRYSIHHNQPARIDQ